MSKILITTLCLLAFGNSLTVFAQEKKSLRVEYVKDVNVLIDTSKIKENKSKISDMNSSIIESSKDLSYELLINDFHSIFKENKSMIPDKNDGFRRFASSIGGTKGIFYINKNDSIYINKKEYFGQSFRVELKPQNWRITNETKLINNFKCYKATLIESITNTKGTFKNNVTAWFSPELPSFFGPAGYFGLPGLIMEIDNSKIKLRAVKIKFDNLYVVKPLNKGVLVTKEEYDKLVSNTAKDRLKSLFKN